MPPGRRRKRLALNAFGRFASLAKRRLIIRRQEETATWEGKASASPKEGEAVEAGLQAGSGLGGDVATENAAFTGAFAQLGESGLHIWRFWRGHQIQIEAVFERVADNRAAFDLHEIDIAARNGFQGLEESARLMAQENNEGDFIGAFRLARGRRKQEKARVIFAMVFQVSL